MPIDARLVTIPNEAPPFWVLYAHTVLLRCVAQGNTDQIAAWCTWAGGATFTFFPSSRSLLSNFCLISDGTKGIGVFAGTRNLSQIIGQLAGSGMSLDFQTGGFVSSFDLFYADAVGTLARDSVPPSFRALPVLITGHSLGGAIAHIFANRRIDGTFTDVGLLTFGEPRVGDRSFLARDPARYCRIVNSGDTIPGIPPRTSAALFMFNRPQDGLDSQSYRHGGNEWLITVDEIAPSSDQATGTDLAAISFALAQGLEAQTGIEQYHPLSVYSSAIYAHAFTVPGIPDISPLVTISRAISGGPPITPDPANAPMVPPAPPLASLIAPGFQPIPLPGSLPPAELNQEVVSIEVPTTFVASLGTTHIFLGDTMPNPICKVTFFYQQLGQGFQEVYYNNASTIAACIPLANALGNALMAFRGENTALINYRISLQNVPLQFPRLRTARLFPPLVGWQKGSFVQAPANVPPENWSDMFSVCVLMRGVPAAFGQPAKSIFMRGLPDDYDVRGGELNGQLWQFFGMQRVQALQQALAPPGNPFGWLGTVTPVIRYQSGFNVGGITQNGNGTVSFALSVDISSFPASALGNPNVFVPVRISGVKQPGNINGVIPVSVNGAGTILTSKKRIAVAPYDGSSGLATYIPKTFIPFSGSIIAAPRTGNVTTYGNLWAVRISERAAGRIFGQTKGRKKNRVRA